MLVAIDHALNIATEAASAGARPGQVSPIAAMTAAAENAEERPWTHCFLAV